MQNLKQGQNLGVISALEENLLGEKSLYIAEIVILKEYKGEKLATAVQRKFIETLKSKYQFVWGMISAKNIPSSKNALRVGRKIISSEILLPI
jgi:hypothetical protein